MKKGIVRTLFFLIMLFYVRCVCAAEENSIILNYNESENVLSVKGMTTSSSVTVNLSDYSGAVCGTQSTQCDNSGYYYVAFDFSGFCEGIYKVSADYGGTVLEELYSHVLFDNTYGTMNISVDYAASAVKINGIMADKTVDNVMLTVFKPGYDERAFLDTENMNNAVYHIEQQNCKNGFYSFSYNMGRGMDGCYTAVVQSKGKLIKKTFCYYRAAIDCSNGVDEYTTTYYAPWMVNYHLTSEEQLEAGYKGGEAGQMCWSMAIAPTNTDWMMVGTDTGGIWKSEDGGTTWRSCAAGFGVVGTADIAFDPENENTVYALGSTGGKQADTYTGIYKSENGGDTWRLIQSNLYYRTKNNPIIKFSARDANGERKIYVGGHGGGVGCVYSKDDGETWLSLGEEVSGYIVKDLLLVNDMLVLATNKGIFVSSNDGLDWENRSPVLNATGTMSVTTYPNNSTHWICSYNNSIYESFNSGLVWTKINTVNYIINSVRFGLGSSPRLYILLANTQFNLRYSDDCARTLLTPRKSADSTEYMKDNKGWGGEPFVLHPSDPNIVFVSFDGEIYKSTDGGESYHASSSGYSGMRVADFLFNPRDNNDIRFAVTDRGVIKTIDSGKGQEFPLTDYSASEDSTGIRYNGNKTVQAIARDPKNPDRYIICIGDWYDNCALKQSADGGLTYTVMKGTEGYSSDCIEFNKDNPNTIYSGRLISYDNGNTWNASGVKVYAVSPFDGNIVYGVDADSSLVKSTDEGRTWNTLGLNAGSVSEIVPDLFEKDTIYVLRYGNSIIRIDGGNNIRYFSKARSDIENSDKFFTISFAQDPKNPMHFIVGGYDFANNGQGAGIYESFDGGDSWRVVKGMPASKDIWRIEFHPNLPRVYIGTSSGVYIYEYEKYRDDEVVITNRTLYSVAEKCSYSMKLWNTVEKQLNLTVFVAMYDKTDESLISVSNKKCYIKPLNNVTVNFELNLHENAVIKTFVWDGGSIMPLENYDWNLVE